SELCGFHDFGQLEIQDHLYLKAHPEFKVSLSHTRGLSAAVLGENCASVGIDIERIDRRFNPATQKYYLTTEDRRDLTALELWCIKEAAFKAFAPLKTYQTIKDVLVLKDLNVIAENIIFNGKEVASWNCQKHDDLITAIAWI